ncbi:MAG TPA: 1-acyl-sn-glycerol-3-phosphate acyltransferase [Leptolyngbyaceae cyanobacterium]
MPPLTLATIKRATEGLAAARSIPLQLTKREALENAGKIARHEIDRKVNGELRRLIVRTFIHALFEVKVEYPERIPQFPAILAPNHLSHFDPLLILAEVPARPFYYILGDSRSLYNKRWKRLLLRLSQDTIPLDRLWKEEVAVMEGAKCDRPDLTELANAIAQNVPTGNSIEALRRLDTIIQDILAAGDGIVIFPEGRLGNREGELRLPFKRGTVIYALRGGVPIVPVAIIGTQDLYLRKQLTLRFGKPLIFPQSKRPKPQEVQTALDTLQAALMDLLPKNYQEPNGLKIGRHFLNHLLW